MKEFLMAFVQLPAFFSCKRFKCLDGLSEFDKVDILKRRLDLPSENEQDLFIQSLIDIHDVKDGVQEKITHVKLRQHTRTLSYLVTKGLSYVTMPFCL